MFNHSYLTSHELLGVNIQERNIPTFQYCRPGANLNIRKDSDNKPKPGEEPINTVDASCYEQDIRYRDAGDDLSKKHEADRIMLQ